MYECYSRERSVRSIRRHYKELRNDEEFSAYNSVTTATFLLYDSFLIRHRVPRILESTEQAAVTSFERILAMQRFDR